MSFFEDMLDEGMRATQRIMKTRGVTYEEARKLAATECGKCNGNGWLGHGMGGDTCDQCNGKGTVK